MGDLRGQRRGHRLDRVGDRLALPPRRPRRPCWSRHRRGSARRALASVAVLPAWLFTGLHGPASRAPLEHRPGTSPRPAPSSSAAAWRSCRSSTAASWNVPLADRSPVPRRGRGGDDHAGAGGHHRRIHRLPRRRAARGDGGRARRLPALLPLRDHPGALLPADRQEPQVKAFVDGVTAAATGAIAGAVFVLGRRAIVDIPTLLILASTYLVLVKARKVPEPVVILAAGMIGFLLTQSP